MDVNVHTLVQAECCDEQVTRMLKDLAQEMKDLELKKQDVLPSPVKIPTISESQMIQNPPSVPFFTKKNHHLYTEDTLIWKTKEIEKSKMSLLSHASVRKLLSEGLMQRQFLHSSHSIRFILHTMVSTTDDSLRYQAYNSLCYLVQSTNARALRLHLDLYMALDNLGADLSKVGRDMSRLTHSMIPPRDDHRTVTPDISLTPTQLRDTLRLILDLFSTVLAENGNSSHSSADGGPNLSMEELDELVLIFIALGLDPKVVESGLDHQIASCISHCLNLYPTHLQFYKRIQDLVELIVAYCDFKPHNVSYVCCHHLLPTPRGCVLKSSLAFIQLQICLNVEKKVVYDVVELKDVTRLVKERLSFFKAGNDGYMMYFIIKLLDCCMHQEVLSDAEKEEIQNLEQMLEPVYSNIRDNVDDLNLTVVRFYAVQVLEKWRRKRGSMVWWSWHSSDE